jgi:hypothetical protein
MKPIMFLFIKFSPHNIFVNIFKTVDQTNKKIPLFSKSLNSENYIRKEYIKERKTFEEFIDILAI